MPLCIAWEGADPGNPEYGFSLVSPETGLKRFFKFVRGGRADGLLSRRPSLFPSHLQSSRSVCRHFSCCL